VKRKLGTFDGDRLTAKLGYVALDDDDSLRILIWSKRKKRNIYLTAKQNK
jgi:hypothetical protein